MHRASQWIVRSGHHCAQPILRRFGLESTVRPSLAFDNNCEDVDRLIAALVRLSDSRPGPGLPDTVCADRPGLSSSAGPAWRGRMALLSGEMKGKRFSLRPDLRHCGSLKQLSAAGWTQRE